MFTYLEYNENKKSMEIGRKNGIMGLETDTSMNKEQNGEMCHNRMNTRCDKSGRMVLQQVNKTTKYEILVLDIYFLVLK